ncbi:sensor histidine kinase [Fulvivirga lutimaris]|uniref:sensor histidine kinase n=1 Tax=Fulvivirga lutimaris TaxID=1819566 RepID=UPI0012BB90FB|nr:ATP-binding protein [Fulvivirga lutimaris]MTI41992.1 GHKL domain-containing protein [Fulvivirga lutimaris]
MSFKFHVIFRCLLILLASLVLSWVLLNRDWFFTPLVLVLILSGLVANLIYYVEKTSRNLAQFLLNVKQGGFTHSFKNDQEGHNKLNKVFNDVIEEFHRVSMERESHYLYLQTLNENLGVALISYDEEGKIDLLNPAAKNLLKRPILRHIDELKEIDDGLLSMVKSLQSGDRKVLKTIIDNQLIQLSIQCKLFKVQDKTFTLLLIQNINEELEQKEVEAWQRLVSVLTHEIMNSVTPIASLSDAFNNLLERKKSFNNFSEEETQDLSESLKTIERRSKGLMKFVNAYKDFAKNPDLNITQFELNELLQRIIKLFQPDLESAQIEIKYQYAKEGSTIAADYDLMEHVIINLIKNAIEALRGKENAVLGIQLAKSNRQISLKIIDNGPGIAAEDMDKVFIPFYTTKKAGSGVGLSLARKIIKLHDGNLLVKSIPNQYTCFTIELEALK